jgi:nitrite reductase/ring-hydroxylating ferredoxin subunit
VTGTLLALGSDALALRQLQRVAEELGLEVVIVASRGEATGVSEPPLAIVIDLELPTALTRIGEYKQRWPRSLIAGYVNVPDPGLWKDAIDAGCDLVTSRGALARQLSDKLRAWATDPGGPRLRLFSSGEIAGRIGLVARLADTPVGPLAVYHLGGEVLVAADVCPHAGAVLSEGELLSEPRVITCPRHGSQFSLTDGARVRGPADDPIRTFRVVREGTEVYVRLDLPGACLPPAGTP